MGKPFTETNYTMKTENYPEIVYKYRNWKEQFQKDVIEKNNLYLTAPNYFNDPFDCRITKDYLSLNTPEKIKQYADDFISRQGLTILNMGGNLLEEKKIIINVLSNNLEDFHQSNENYVYALQDIYYGVLSLTTKWNSIMMWSHYGDYHRGVCYGFWEEKLRKSNLFGKGGPVTYPLNNEFPSIDPLDNNVIKRGFIETHTKSLEWKYEYEYRLFNLFFPKIPTNEDRVRKIPNDFFAEIVIGISTPEKDKAEIIKLAKEKGIRIFQAKKVAQRFEITREEII